MAEYIDKERAKKRFISDYAYAAAKILDELPAADVVEIKHGYWNKYINEGDSMPQYKCSCCGVKPILSHNWVDMLTNYCPNCGAKMGGENNV